MEEGKKTVPRKYIHGYSGLGVCACYLNELTLQNFLDAYTNT